MNNSIIAIIASSLVLYVNGQSFAPAAGQLGSTAITKDSSIIVAWATGIELHRGYLNKAQPLLGTASYGTENDALYEAQGDATSVVSLGDSGVAILRFDAPITNGFGSDFAVFENGFADNYLELAFVEVSSDGIQFVRFPSFSETPIISQVGPFDYSDCRYVHNLAGKYRTGFGTPFDLEELVGAADINLNAITHVKIVDVVGSIDPSIGSFDSQGMIINDLYPTDFPTGGFDLDAVAVIHQAPLKLDETNISYNIHPNPTNDWITVETEDEHSLAILDATGRILENFPNAKKRILSMKKYASQILFVKIQVNDTVFTQRVICH